MAGPRELLGQRRFRGLYLARVSSQAADGVFLASLVGFVLFNPQDAPTAAALAGSLAAVLLPFSVVAPFAGILLDRVDRRQVIVRCSLARAAILAGLAVLMLAGHSGVDLLALAVIGQSVSRFVLSALSAAQPVVVATEDLVAATSLSTTSGTVATTVGAALGGGVRLVAGSSDRALAAVGVVALVAYLLATAVATRVPVGGLGPLAPRPWASLGAEVRGVLADTRDGARVLAGVRAARRGLIVISVARLCYGVSFVATILLYRVYFAAPGTSGDLVGLGEVVAAAAVGTIAAALVTPRAVARIGRDRWVAVVLVGAGVADLAFGVQYDARLFLLASLALGFAQQAAKICVDALVQREVPDAYRGRAFSFYDVSFNLSYVAAAALGAALLPADGKSRAVLALVVLTYVGVGLAYGALSALRPAGPPAPAPASSPTSSPASSARSARRRS